MSEDLHRRVSEHEGRITQIAAEVSIFGKELHGIKEGMNLLFGKIDNITAGLHQLQANKPAPTMEVLRTVFSMATSVAILMAAIVSGIVYVSSNANNVALTELKQTVEALRSQGTSPSEFAVVQQRVIQLEKDFERAGWQPQVKFTDRR